MAAPALVNSALTTLRGPETAFEATALKLPLIGRFLPEGPAGQLQNIFLGKGPVLPAASLSPMSPAYTLPLRPNAANQGSPNIRRIGI